MSNQLHRSTLLVVRNSMVFNGCVILQALWDKQEGLMLSVGNSLMNRTVSNVESAIAVLRSNFKHDEKDGYVLSPVSIEVLEALDTLFANGISVDCKEQLNLTRSDALELLETLFASYQAAGRDFGLMRELGNAYAGNKGFDQFTFEV